MHCTERWRKISPYGASARVMACQIWSLISLATGLGTISIAPLRFWQSATRRKTHTSPLLLLAIRCSLFAHAGRHGPYRLVSRQPAASASSTEQNQRVPLLILISIFLYQRLVGR